MKKLLILFFLLTNQCSANFFYTPNWLQIRWWALQAKKCADEPNVDTPDQIQKTEFQFASAAEKAVWTSFALQKILYFFTGKGGGMISLSSGFFASFCMMMEFN